MLIRDLEGKSGLDRATIRFYEREGLINPERKENGYREYTQAHLDQLLKIRLLRQLGMSLETIKGLQKGTEDFSKALETQIRALEQRIRDTTRAKDICTELYHANTTYATLNAQYYLHRLSQPEQNLIKRSFREPVNRQYHPVRRYFARMTDYAIVRLFLEFLAVIVFRIRPFGDFISGVISYGVPFLMVPLFAFMLSRWGTTPGKWLFGLSVQSENGGNLTYSAAKEREWQVLREGFGFGIPFWSIWRLYKSYNVYSEWEMDWDYCAEYQYGIFHRKQKSILAAALSVIVCLNLWIASDIVKPRFRGELTVSEFAANYNFYYTFVDDQPERSERLQPDGTWYPETDGHVTVYVGGQPMVQSQNFQFQTENEKVCSIQYENTWTDVFMFSPITGKCQNAAITAVMSQQGMGLWNLFAFAEQMESVDLTEDGKITYENIEILWNIDTQNCKLINGQYFMQENESLESSVTIQFEIVIHS